MVNLGKLKEVRNMKVRALVKCIFEIEYEDESDDINEIEESIRMSNVDELTSLETDESIQYITVIQSVVQK